MNIRKKITIIITGLILISLIAIASFMDFKSSDLILKQTETSSLELTKAQVDNITTTIEKEEVLPDYGDRWSIRFIIIPKGCSKT